MGHTRGLFFWACFGPLGLLADLPADSVFLLVERFLLGGRDVAVVELRHRPLFLADRMILAVKLAGLPFGDFALPQLFIDPPVLVLQAVVDLGAPRWFFSHWVSAATLATAIPVNATLHAMAAAFAARLMGCPFWIVPSWLMRPVVLPPPRKRYF